MHSPAHAAAPPEAALPLPEALARTLRASRLPADSFGLHVRPLQAGAPVFALNDAKPFVLASTAKLVTTYAALQLLGPGWRWRTYAYAGGPVHRGRLEGDLVIVGGGDALLTTADLRAWFVQMRAEGLYGVAGNIVLDDHAFDLPPSEFAGEGGPQGVPPRERPQALVLDRGQVSPLAVKLAWLGAGGALAGRVVERHAPPPATPPAGRGGEELPQPPLSVHRSPPLPALVREINKRSDNCAAHNLMLSLARGFPARAATPAAARTRVRDWLARAGIGAGELALDTGSGLSRADRGTPRALVRLLEQAWTSELSDAFVDSLPVAGVDGTLAHRLRRGAAAGRAWLKTGTLHDARALAGYVRAESGRTYAVAALVNHPAAARATPTLDAVIERVARLG